jgi:hypothetical protein
MRVFGSRRLLAGCVGTLALAGALGIWYGGRAHSEEKAAPDPARVERTRQTVRLLDDLYKSAVVHITETYVTGSEKRPAATVAKKVFADMKAKGHHAARLIDISGRPIKRDNVAKTAFEKRAASLLKKGKAYYEEVDSVKGKPVLRAATLVPAVMNQCVDCHPHVSKGDPLGAIIYEVPIR